MRMDKKPKPEKPEVGCLRLTPDEWSLFRRLWHARGGRPWLVAWLKREDRKHNQAAGK